MHPVHVHQEEGEEGHQAALQVQEVGEVLSHHLQVGVGEVELLDDLEEVEEEELLDANPLEVVEEVEGLNEHLEGVVAEEDLHVHLEGAEVVEGLDENLVVVVVAGEDLHVHQGEGEGVLLFQVEGAEVGVLLFQAEGVAVEVLLAQAEGLEEGLPTVLLEEVVVAEVDKNASMEGEVVVEH